MTAPLDDVETLRRRIMSAVRGKNTKPEMIVRRMLHSMKYRYRLHRNDLPGRPDIVFGRRRKVIFVHGCFWHRHPGCLKASSPKTRSEFWTEKFERNVERDARVVRELSDLGWETLTVWECETRTPDELKDRFRAFLEQAPRARAADRIAA